jgi:hypothetical protein
MSEADEENGSGAQRIRGEGELTADLITAATRCDGPLSQEQVDEILGVQPGDEDAG